MGKWTGGLFVFCAVVGVSICGLAVAEPLSEAQTEAYLDQIGAIQTFDVFEGQNEALKSATADEAPQQVAAGFPVDLDTATLFPAGFSDAGWQVYVAAVSSIDALGLRLRVNLATLGDGDELWEIDPTLPRAFGPYGVLDFVPGGRWLPTIEGDTAVLVVRTHASICPPVTVDAVSHFYWNLVDTKAALSCNLNVACENAAIQALTGAIGFMVIPSGSYDQAFCSGCLIESVVNGPYFLGASHCVPTARDPWNVEIVWDYKKSSCSTAVVPSLSSLPRSAGVALLAVDTDLDGTLLLLDEVSSTRTRLAWDTRDPVVGEDVFILHHPAGGAALNTCYMRISKGEVQLVDTNPTIVPFIQETKVLYHQDEGVTEGGSSGGPLLLDDGAGGYAVTGMLSGGPNHTCGGTNNYDYFASFRDFYPEIDGYLSGTPPATPANVQASDGTYSGLVRITWTAVAGATSYRVYRSDANQIDGGLTVLTNTATGTSYDDTTSGGGGSGCFGASGPEYYYWVRARNSDGDSGYSLANRGYGGKSASALGAGSLTATPPEVRGDMLVLAAVASALALAGRRRTRDLSVH